MNDEQRPALRPVPDGERHPPADNAAEQAVLGAILHAPRLAAELVNHLQPDDFYQPRHETIWRAIHAVDATGQPADAILVAAHLGRTGQLNRVGGPVYLAELMEACPIPSAGAAYAARVRDVARLRKIGEVGLRLRQLSTGEDLEQALIDAFDTVDQAVMRFGPTVRTPIRHVLNIDEFLDAGDITHDWLIPGLLERRDRVILTGGEGSGKSTLGRQVGIQAAAGIHPFTAEIIKPARVLILDFENSENQLRRALRPLRIRAGERLTAEHLHVESRIAGVDLTGTEDRAWVEGIIAGVRPDLVITGPIYKMADGDPNEEKSAKPVALFLDQMRASYGCAFWLEAHVGNEANGQRNRPKRPVGWSGWRRWPEFGLWLDETGAIEHWRGDRDERKWPVQLQRGGEWPWSPVRNDLEYKWHRIKECIEEAGEEMSQREIAKRVDLSVGTVNKVLKAYSMHYKGLLSRLEIEASDE